jgi:hypothetical protein
VSASIVRIDGVLVSNGGDNPRKRRRVPLIPQGVPISGDWYERRRVYAEDIYNKIKLPPWVRNFIAGETKTATKDWRATASCLGYVLARVH